MVLAMTVRDQGIPSLHSVHPLPYYTFAVMGRAKGGHVYIMTNRHHTTLYVGVSSALPSRVLDHKNKKDPKSFTARYNLNKLVYYEFHELIEGGIEREKQLKAGSRQRKVDLINRMNPEWRELYDDIKDW